MQLKKAAAAKTRERGNALKSRRLTEAAEEKTPPAPQMLEQSMQI